MRKIYRLHYVESERGWGQSYWHNDFATREEAEKAKQQCNAENTSLVAPDYYIVAQDIEEIVTDGKEYFKKMN